MTKIQELVLGTNPAGESVKEYTLTNDNGAWIKLISLGATISGVGVPDKDGKIDDVALGYKDWQSYQNDGAAFGKSVGRFANRIALGKFSLEGKNYTLAINNGVNALHGGPTGFQNRVWESRIEDNKVIFTYVAADGEEGYPGELTATAIYSWDDDCNLNIEYRATTTATTVVNLTNHIYFNLKGEGQGIIEDHKLQIFATNWLPTDSTQVPTGEIAPVAGTPMDFVAPTVIGSRIEEDFEALKIGKGYDHCWVIDNFEEGKLTHAATLSCEATGRSVEVRTTQPGVQIYTGNWLAGAPISKCGAQYVDRSGVAMECQNYPDAPNKPSFPSPVLKSGEEYRQTIRYTFKNA